MAATMTGTEAIDPWLTMADATAYTGFSDDTIRRAIKRGDLIASGGGVSGRVFRIRRSALDRWLEQRGRGGEGTS